MVFAALALCAAVETTAVPREREMRVVFGTFAEIEIEGAADPASAFASAFERIDAAEKTLSIWREDSEISRLNQSGDAVVAKELFSAIEKAVEVSRASNGAFDVTLEPFGFERIRLDAATKRVTLEGVELDLGAVLKGHAVDVALESLAESRVSKALVDLGTSSIGVFGDEPVTFEVRNPAGGPSPASFRLREGAVASSSRDQLGAHIEDPRTGEAVAGVLSVTVVAKTGFEADALSTAVFVLGEAAGLALLEARGAAGLVLVEENGCLILSSTPDFDRRYQLETGSGVTIRQRSSLESSAGAVRTGAAGPTFTTREPFASVMAWRRRSS